MLLMSIIFYLFARLKFFCVSKWRKETNRKAPRTLWMDSSSEITFSSIELRDSVNPSSSLFIFVRELPHELSVSYPLDRTVSVECIPPHVTQDDITSVFSQFGQVERVEFAKHKGHSTVESRKGFHTGYVTFVKKGSQRKALSSTELYSVIDSSTRRLGIKSWCEDYQKKIIKPTVLMAEVEGFMKGFDDLVIKQTAETAANAEEDDEGWTTVGRSGKKRTLPRRSNVEEKVLEKLHQSQRDAVEPNFYRFQVKDSRQKSLDDLRQKFEEDKKKVISMKNARKFKPY